ncbi:MAG: hypothetical protein ACT6FF_05985 [Methanosarcinaceae archaeon]
MCVDGLIKFRPLANLDDLKRAKQIIENGKFWCSKLWNLNDPMEGVYETSCEFKHIIDDIFKEKNKVTIQPVQISPKTFSLFT